MQANQSQVTTEEDRLLQSTLMASVDRRVPLCPLMAFIPLLGGKADIALYGRNVCFRPKADIGTSIPR